MKTLISALVLLALTQPAPNPAAAPADRAVPSLGLPSPQPPRSTGALAAAPNPPTALNVAGRGLGGQTLWEQACTRVLVVPNPGLTDESLAQVTEDLTVMCRILDKAVASSPSGVRPRSSGRYADPLLGVDLMDEEPQTEGLFLGGYGALFFLQVDFPLRAATTQPETTPAQGGPTADPTWSQTVEELQGSPSASPAGPDAAVPYDAGKVENLKTALIRSLRHAANLRLARAQDFITLVVGPQDSRARPSYGVPTVQPYVRGEARTGPDAGAGAQAEPASVLVMRVRKSEADALAKGQLTAEQFAEKVQLFWSQAYRGPTGPAVPVRSYIQQRR